MTEYRKKGIPSFDAYTLYIALKNHFKLKSYDYFKYNGRVRISLESFESRPDTIYFQRLSKISKSNQYNLLLSNLMINPDIWIGDLFTENGKNYYTRWKKYNSAPEYYFKEDLLKIDFSKDLLCTSLHPKLLKKYMNGNVRLETMCILNDVIHLLSKWDKLIDDDLLWPEVKTRIEKYRPFLGEIDVTKYKCILKECI